jgi:hypothetical protein
VSARVLAASVILTLFAIPAYGQDEKLKWEDTFAQAVAKAKEEGKQVFADFTSEIN